jgi:predicted HTH domain antitoxin
MKAVNIRQLKNNPSDALRMARQDLVVVMNRDKPEALLIHLDDEKLLSEPGVRVALATTLYKDESLSLGKAAKLAHMVLVEFMQHVSRQGIPVIRGDAGTVKEDMRNIEAWLALAASWFGKDGRGSIAQTRVHRLRSRGGDGEVASFETTVAVGSRKNRAPSAEVSR